MRLAILSDSHGNVEDLRSAVAFARPDAAVFLGDCCPDAVLLGRSYPDLPIHMVRGNCDPGVDAPDQLLLELEGHRLLLCHGHRYGVKLGFEGLCRAAREAGADIALFGHTHRAWKERRDGVLLLNPGSISGRGETTFAVLELEGPRVGACFVQWEWDRWLILG